MSNLRLVKVEYDQAPPLSVYYDRNIFQTAEWLKFISLTQNAETVIAVVLDGEQPVGRFTGLVIKKYRIRILGSPFPGWSTFHMGFNLDKSVSPIDALIALKDFAFNDLKCMHIEIMDRNINPDHLKNAGYTFNSRRTSSGFEIDLTINEDYLLSNMSTTCRWCIRKSGRNGVKVEVANDDLFVQDYYSQLKDVFAKQGLVPTYSIERVNTLVECLSSSGMLLCVRARNREGICIATGIFLAMNDTMHFWGGASWRSFQKLYPNEAIQWFAMQYWKERGIKRYYMGGGGEYKRKYGGYEIHIPWGRKSKYIGIELLRNLTKEALHYNQHLKYLRKRNTRG